MNVILERFMTLVPFLGKVLGSDYEVVLHDLSEGGNAIVAIANGHISGRAVGAPLTDMGLRVTAEKGYRDADYEVNYRGVSKDRRSLRSSTYYIKDGDGSLLGMLCLNFDPDRCLNAAGAILAMGNMGGLPDLLDKPEPLDAGEGVETFAGSVADAVDSAMAQVLGGKSIEGKRLSMEEKVRIVEALQKHGLFRLKGAVSEVAERLDSSEASVYRYLNKLK